MGLLVSALSGACASSSGLMVDCDCANHAALWGVKMPAAEDDIVNAGGVCVLRLVHQQ